MKSALPDSPRLAITFCSTETISPPELKALCAMCSAAYEEDITPVLRDIGPGLHALGHVRGTLVSHAMIVSRELQVANGTTLRTAYVELVATDPSRQRQGYASELLRALATQMRDYDIGALSPSEESFYARLGWERWRGPLLERTATGVFASPSDEEVMILRLPRTPAGLDLDAPLSVEWRPGDVW